jgi:peptidoglycan/xylan/chitin deacetylase (PgdA/CDA1 family)
MIFTYHEITQKPSGYLYSATSEQLAEHLSFLRSSTDLRSPTETVSGKRADHCIVFDDGHASQYRYGLPALAKASMSGIFFVTASWTDSRAQYMSSSQLRELTGLGHSIHSHGWSHKLLTQCSPTELTMELRRSREALEDVVGLAVDAISMPAGRCNDRVLTECAEVGYRTVYTSAPWAPDVRRCGVAIRGRLMVKRTMNAAALDKLLRTETRRYSHQRAGYALKHMVKRVVGDTVYAAVWRYMAATDTRRDIDAEYPEGAIRK